MHCWWVDCLRVLLVGGLFECTVGGWTVSGPSPRPRPTAGDKLLHRSRHAHSPCRLHHTLQGSSLSWREVTAHPMNTKFKSASI